MPRTATNKCSYCPEWKVNVKALEVETKKWIKIWDDIFYKYGCCHVRFCGGEPTIYPNFFHLVDNLLKRHTVDITTNLSFDLSYFLDRIKPGRISISASFHPEYASIEEFTDKVYLLLIRGYLSTVTCVAYPPFLNKLGYYKQVAEQKGLIFKISSFSGEFKGVRYPEGYSGEERSLLNRLAEDTPNPEQKSINTEWISYKTGGDRKRQWQQKRCRMGQMYAMIYPDGRVTRCCAKDSPVLGNILEETFRLLEGPQSCSIEICPCFKAMFVGCQEDKWIPLWDSSVYHQQ